MSSKDEDWDGRTLRDKKGFLPAPGRGQRSNVKGISEMLQFMEHEVVEATLDDMVATSNRTFAAVNKIYYQFFEEMEQFVLDAFDEDRVPPASIRPYLASTFWQDTSYIWSNWKRKVNKGKTLGFYHGTSRFRKKSRSKPFASFLSDIAVRPRPLDKMLGGPLMQFDVSKAGRRFTVTSNRKKVQYKRTGPTQAEKPFTKGELTKTYEIGVTIASFPKLLPYASGNWSEWKFVDQMITAIGRGSPTAKQLVKINGRSAYGESSRPIRPLIIPTIILQLQKIEREIKKVF